MSATPSLITREAGTSAATVGRRRPSLSHILIAIAVILAFGLNYLALQDRGATRLVAVADRDLLAGAALSASDLRLTEIPADFGGLEAMVTAEEVSAHSGWIVTRSIPAGTVLDRASLAEPATFGGMRVMSIPVNAEHAAGAGITIGDRVDVIAVVDEVASFIATDLEVMDVPDISKSAFSGSGGYYVVVAVDGEQALLLASAISSGSLEVVRSTGAAPIREES